MQAGGDLGEAVAHAVGLVDELAAVPPARGEVRRRALDDLRLCDAQLIVAATAQCDAQTWQALVAEAEEELAPFRQRMPAEAYEQSRQACVTRLLRERLRLPVLTYE